MPDSASLVTVFVVTTILLFVLLMIAILVIVDHKARLSDDSPPDPYRLEGIRRDHPLAAFFVTAFLLSIISMLLFEIVSTLGTRTGLLEPRVETTDGLISQSATAESMRHFHHMSPREPSSPGSRSACHHCHGDYPHADEPMIRTMLNMHTQFLGCMTCHLDDAERSGQELTFRWQNPSGEPVTGRPFGVDIDPETGYLAATDDHYSKIVALRGTESLELWEDHQDAARLITSRAPLSDPDAEAAKQHFHRPLAKIAVDCTPCHQDEARSYLPYRELDFSDRRVADLTNLDIVGLLENYEVFYLPRLIESEPEAVEEQRDMPTGTPESVRSWWEQTFDADPATSPDRD